MILKKQLILPASIVFSLFAYTVKAQDQNDLNNAELKGPVKAVYTQTYEATGNLGEAVKGNQISNEITQYNSKGMITDDRAYWNGRTTKKIVVSYDEKGNKTELVFFKPDGSIIFKTKYLYNAKGEMIEEKTSYSDSISNFKKTYAYDAGGNLAEKNLYDAKGELKNRSTYKYDSRKNETEACNYAGGVLFRKAIKTYNANGRLLETKVEEESAPYLNKYSYDGRGNLVQDDEYKNGILSLKTIYTIDYKGAKTEECTYGPNGKIKNKKTYDKEGNLAEDTDYNDLGTVKSSKTLKYQYDLYGNWRTKTTMINSKISISERTLEYY